MSKPEPHGIDHEYKLKQTVAKQLKVDKFLTTVSAVQWRDIPDIIKKHIEYNEGFCKPKESYETLHNSFTEIGSKTNFKSLSIYCKALAGDYFSYETKFLEEYRIELKDYEAKKAMIQEVDLAGTLLVTQKISRIKRKASIEASQKLLSSSKNRKRSTKPPNSTTTIIPLNSPDDCIPAQYDEIKVPGRDETVSALLKVEGRRLHTHFKNDEALTKDETKRMSSSLSSILDLIDNSVDGQKALFSNEQWDYLCNKFAAKKDAQLSNIKKEVSETWKLVAKLAELDGCLDRSRKYVDEVFENQKDTANKTFLKIYHAIMDLYEENPMVFDKIKEAKFTESDYVTIIWAPLIRKLLSIKKLIRLKVGESVNEDSTNEKKLQYESGKKTIGPKIDMRFILDIDDQEVDLGAVECAKSSPSDTKLFDDEGKLVKEGKDIVDGILNRLHQVPIDKIEGQIMQIAGLVGEISCVKLIAPGLYTATPVNNIKIPSNTALLEPFIYTLENLVKSITIMENMALLIKKSNDFFNDRRRSFGLKFGRPMEANNQNNSYQSWIRGTYYFPANGVQRNSLLPSDLNEDIKPYAADRLNEEPTVLNVKGKKVDKNGWVELEDGRYYNALAYFLYLVIEAIIFATIG